MIFLGLRWRFVRINPRNLLLFIVPEVEEDRRHQAGLYIFKQTVSLGDMFLYCYKTY